MAGHRNTAADVSATMYPLASSVKLYLFESVVLTMNKWTEGTKRNSFGIAANDTKYPKIP